MYRRAFIILALSISCKTAHGELLVDDFTSGPTSLSGRNALLTQPNLPGVLGGDRIITWNDWGPKALSPAAAGVTTSLNVDVNTSNGGSFIYTATNGITALRFQLLYNGSVSSPPNMNVDLGAAGNMLAIDLAYADFFGHSGQFDVIVSSDNGGSEGRLSMYTPVPTSPTPFTLLLPLADPSLDIHHVTELSIGSRDGNLQGAFAITSIRIVPEPGAILTIVTVAGMLMRKKVAHERSGG